MAVIGYARVSTNDRQFEVPLEALRKVIYQEKASGAVGARVEERPFSWC
jgi:DNA invertase Pin-like site-specific DNA recombinase